MRVHDCDDPSQFDELNARLGLDGLLGGNLLQSFAPDTLEEAMNRGFRPIRRLDPAQG